ncbi:MAG: MBOAT family protein [Muribaculaceae bacterium]|nr:MBOAT family protein [Muribaculaceae bacterium]
MLFNSFEFLLFFPIVVLLYWILPYKFRNPMLLVASYYFYMNWEPVYALLILFSSITTWGCGLLITRSQYNNQSVAATTHEAVSLKNHRKVYLMSCIILNIAILFFYKYLGFASDSLKYLMLKLGISMYVPHFDLLLPVGISFYTFQAVGYIIDVYRKDITAERNFFTYALFVSFFPQLVAGPIERAKNLLPQFSKIHHFNGEYMITGLKMMIWGYFMKLCIADSVSSYVDAVFNNIQMHNGKSIWLASFFFTFQIFCDFAGYSLIAIGTAKCLGFDLMQNFRQPYLAHNVKEFWRRWHISLSTWLSDYIYKPLGGNRKGTLRHHRNLLLTFLISGLWHGANWTFVLWGAYHGFLQSLITAKTKLKTKYKIQKSVPKFIGIVITFILMLFGWVLFRANNIGDAFTAWKKMLHPTGLLFNGAGKPAIILSILMILILMCREFANEYNIGIKFTRTNLYYSGICSGLLIVLIFLCADFDGGAFIYFQF